MTKYEVMYIIRPNIEEDAKAALVERFNAVLAEGAEILEVNDWGKRRLAYEINDFTDGYYMIVNVQAETAASTQEFDRLAKISEDIIRHMVVKVEA